MNAERIVPQDHSEMPTPTEIEPVESYEYELESIPLAEKVAGMKEFRQHPALPKFASEVVRADILANTFSEIALEKRADIKRNVAEDKESIAELSQKKMPDFFVIKDLQDQLDEPKIKSAGETFAKLKAEESRDANLINTVEAAREAGMTMAQVAEAYGDARWAKVTRQDYERAIDRLAKNKLKLKSEDIQLFKGLKEKLEIAERLQKNPDAEKKRLQNKIDYGNAQLKTLDESFEKLTDQDRLAIALEEGVKDRNSDLAKEFVKFRHGEADAALFGHADKAKQKELLSSEAGVIREKIRETGSDPEAVLGYMVAVGTYPKFLKTATSEIENLRAKFVKPEQFEAHQAMVSHLESSLLQKGREAERARKILTELSYPNPTEKDALRANETLSDLINGDSAKAQRMFEALMSHNEKMMSLEDDPEERARIFNAFLKIKETGNNIRFVSVYNRLKKERS